MFVINVKTGEKTEATIAPLTNPDFKVIQKNKSAFNKFNWTNYRGEEVYKITLKNDDNILGLMCLIDHKDEATNAIEIELLEVGEENIGSEKKLDNIGGCLIAFACRESYKRGHDGVVFLTPKTQLIEHYCSKYGFYHMPIKNPQRPEGLMILSDGD